MASSVPTIEVESPAARMLTQPALGDLADIPATSRWVRSGTVRLHVLDYGPADAVPMVMLPGISNPAIAMDFLARELTDLVRPVIVDIRGRGLSDSAPPDAAGALYGYDLGAYTDDVEAVICGLNLERPILFGHSMGARIAAVATALARQPPRGSVLVDPPMSGPQRGPYPTTLDTFLAQLTQARRGTDDAEVATSWPRWTPREQGLRARWLASCSSTAIAATHAGFESEDFFAVWPGLTSPTTLIYGAESPVVTVAGAAEAAEANPSATVIEVPGTGHMVFWDDPDAGLNAARNAIASLI